jgi:hypothetical protein
MSNATRLPPNVDVSQLPIDGVPSIEALLETEPRGGAIDQAMVIREAANVPPLPGASENAEREKRRQMLIAANRALDGRVINEAAKGTLEGVALAGAVAVGALLSPGFVVMAGAAALGISVFGGRK